MIRTAVSFIMKLKQQIEELRKNGKTYNEIAKELLCSKGTIAYHLSPKVGEKTIKRNFRNRTKNTEELKKLYGGECKVCGYDKCMRALEFHHTDPSQKDTEVSENRISTKRMAEEAKKCILLCANCHREVHDGLITIAESSSGKTEVS